MFISNLFAPKWKHKNIDVRRQALQAMDAAAQESQQIFVEVARTDAQGSIRQLAIRRLQDADRLLALLRDVALNDIHDAAAQRLAQLIVDAEGATLTQRQKTLTAIEEQKVLELVLQTTQEAALAMMVIPRIQRQGLLGDLALGSLFPEVREGALARISQRSTLERVMNESRRNDKHIHALAAARLAAIKAEEERPQRVKTQAKALCRELEALAASAKKFRTWLAKEAVFSEVCRRWEDNLAQWQTAQDGEWPQPLSDQFAESCTAYRAGLEQQRSAEAVRLAEEAKWVPLRARKRQLIDSMASLLKGLEARQQPEEGDAAAIKVLLESCHFGWQESASLPEQEEGELRQRYTALRETLGSWLIDVDRYQTARSAIAGLAPPVAELLASGAADARRLKQLQSRWDDIEHPEHFKLESALLESVTENLAVLNQQAEQLVQQRQADLKEFKALVEPLEQALAAGKFKHASHLARRGQKLLQGLAEADAQRLRNEKIYARYQAALNQVRELEDWRSWSNVPARGQLAEDMERLRQQLEVEGNEIDPRHALDRIKAARREWRRYDTKEVDQSSDAWQCFDHACNTVHAICQQRIAEQHQAQQAHKAVREKVCADLERLYAERIKDADPVAIDWKALEQIIQVAEKEWKDLGAIGHRDWEVLNKRYHHITAQLRKAVRQEWRRNHDAKQGLINQAQSVVSAHTDSGLPLAEAIEQIKQLQAQWREIGRASKDGELWQTFRAVSAVVFDERQAQRQVQRDALDQGLVEKQRLCAEIEQLALLEDDDLKAAQADFERAQQQWQATGKVAKAELPKIEQRYRSACEAFAARNRQRQHDERAAYQQRWLDKAALCAQLEGLLAQHCAGQVDADELATQLAALGQTWEAQAALNAEDEKIMQPRYRHVVELLARAQAEGRAAVAEQVRREGQANQQAREALCLHLEILAGVDSPPAVAQQRLEFQVALLAEKLKNGESLAKDEEARLLERQWWRLGGVPATELAALERRFQNALAVIHKA